MKTEWERTLSHDPQEQLAVVRVLLPDRAALDSLVAEGIDLCESVKKTPGGLEVYAAVTLGEVAALHAAGALRGEIAWTRADWKARVAERKAALSFERLMTSEAERVDVTGACCVRTLSGALLHVRAATTAGALSSVVLTASWDLGPDTAPGSSGSAHLARRTRGGEYLEHWLRIPVTAPPTQVTVISSLGGSRQVAVAGEHKSPDWAAGEPPYVEDVITHYMDPTELYERIEALAREFPDLCEIVAMPHETDGYRRPAQAVLGSDPEASVLVTSRAWGHEGGNRLSVALMAPETRGQMLAVAIEGERIAVRLGADAEGKPTSTAAQVVEALNQAAGHLILAQTFRARAGTGIAAAQGPVVLTDRLAAPASVARAPFRMRALRIGKDRDGSRPGVLVYAQEHAREWVTPLVTIELAERLLRNYAQDPESRSLVDGIDLFLIPSANPDGSHFSFYDYGMQRKNMVYHTGPGHAQHSDSGLSNYWGSDPNRNYSTGSIFDGYTGASTNCLSQVYAGPAKLSEAESRNIVWLVEEYPNIRYATNLHSFGGYIMWPPGVAKAEGPGSLPPLTPEEEGLFRLGAEAMADALKERRGTVIPADQIGTGVEVMYSSAGNSADHLWYARGIYAWSLEVGAARPDSDGEPRAVGFQPDFAEGREEALEFTDALVALLKLIRDRGTLLSR